MDAQTSEKLKNLLTRTSRTNDSDRITDDSITSFATVAIALELKRIGDLLEEKKEKIQPK